MFLHEINQFYLYSTSYHYSLRNNAEERSSRLSHRV